MRKVTQQAVLLLVLQFIGFTAVTGVVVYKFFPFNKALAKKGMDRPWSDPLNDLYQILGSAHSVVIESTELSVDGRREFSRKPFEKIDLDKEGRVIKKVGYRDDGVLLPPTTYLYDHQGKLIESYAHKIDGSIWIITNYIYDTEDRLVESVKRDADDNSILNKKTYSYESQRNYTEMSEFGSDGSLILKVAYLKDSEGKIVEWQSIAGINKDHYFMIYRGMSPERCYTVLKM